MKSAPPVITIRGSGFSGLTLAYFLVQRGHKVRIVEGRTSGLISTQQHPLGLVETAANGLLNSKTVEDLCRSLNIQMIRPKKQSRKRYIFYRGRARRWPLGLRDTLKVIVQIFRLRILKSKNLQPRSKESVQDYAQRVFSKEVLRALIEPALQGIYAGDPARMSARLIFGRLFGGEIRDIYDLHCLSERGSYSGTTAPLQGMGELISALRHYLESQGVEFIKDQLEESAPIGIEWNEAGKSFDTPSEVWATSVQSAALGLERLAPVTAKKLSSAEILPLISVTQFYPKEHGTIEGFGCLFARNEGIRSLGVLFNSCIFEGRSIIHSETWILGGAQDQEVNKLTDAEISAVISRDREKLYGENRIPIEMTVTRWPQALPHLTVEWEQCLESLSAESAVYLHGNYLGRIGLSQILERSKELAKHISEKFKS